MVGGYAPNIIQKMTKIFAIVTGGSAQHPPQSLQSIFADFDEDKDGEGTVSLCGLTLCVAGYRSVWGEERRCV